MHLFTKQSIFIYTFSKISNSTILLSHTFFKAILSNFHLIQSSRLSINLLQYLKHLYDSFSVLYLFIHANIEYGKATTFTLNRKKKINFTRSTRVQLQISTLNVRSIFIKRIITLNTISFAFNVCSTSANTLNVRLRPV